jgi:hypothetical protein
MAGKMHRLPFPPSESLADDVLDLVHADLLQINHSSLGGAQYILTLLDDRSRKLWLAFLKQKSLVLPAFKAWRARVELLSGKRLKVFRSDNGGEFVNLGFQTHFAETGTSFQHSVAHTPQQNGVAERVNRSLVDSVRTMLIESGLPWSLWAEAAGYFAYTKNRSPHRAINDVPERIFTGKTPSVAHLRPFGCRAWMYLADPKERRIKLAPRGLPCILVGYDLEAKAYRLYDPSKRRVELARDVQFMEDVFPAAKKHALERDPDEFQVTLFPQEDSQRGRDSSDDSIPLFHPPDHTPSQEQSLESDITPSSVPSPVSAPITPPNHTLSEPPSAPSHPSRIERTPALSPPLPPLLFESQSPEQSPGHTTPQSSLSPSAQSPLQERTPHHTPSPTHTPDLSPLSTPFVTPLPFATSTSTPREQSPFVEYRERVRFGDSDESESSEDPLDIMSDPEDPPARSTHAHIAQGSNAALLSTFIRDHNVPQSWKQAMESAESVQWKIAGQLEMDTIKERGVWTLVELPPGRKAISSRWVFAFKLNAQGEIVRFKARLVAKGFSQIEGEDYNETFAPVAKFQSIRALLALAAQKGYFVHQMDVTSAFLYGDLDEEIYMQQPEGFIVPGKEHCVLRLHKALYGLKQASRAWYHRFDSVLKTFGFTRSRVDHCVYYLRRSGQVVIIFIYVDDSGIVSSSLHLLGQVKEFLHAHFAMKDLGEAEYVLGIQLIRSPDLKSIILSQKAYLLSILTRFGMKDCAPVSTPMDPKLKLLPSPPDSQPVDAPYAAVIGSLMYAMLGTRPDLAFAVSYLSRFTARPSAEHWTALKRVLRYIKGTLDYGLVYSSTASSPGLLGYSDADWANDEASSRSVGGYVFTLAGGAISWSSTRQHCVTLSSTEAEYVALTEAAKEALWLRLFMEEIGHPLSTSLELRADNAGAIALSKNPEFHKRTKHIRIRYHFIREVVADGSISVTFVPTTQQIADILTKPLGRILFSRFVEMLGIQSPVLRAREGVENRV